MWWRILEHLAWCLGLSVTQEKYGFIMQDDGSKMFVLRSP